MRSGWCRSPLSSAEITGYYGRIANGLLWPVFHYLLERVPLQVTDWATYEAVNARFAAAVARAYRPGDHIWVHDYHLMLLPEMLRGQLPDEAERLGRTGQAWVREQYLITRNLRRWLLLLHALRNPGSRVIFPRAA